MFVSPSLSAERKDRRRGGIFRVLHFTRNKNRNKETSRRNLWGDFPFVPFVLFVVKD
jgi:hypothetical protein